MPTKTVINDNRSYMWQWEDAPPNSTSSTVISNYPNSRTRTDSGAVIGWRDKIRRHVNATSFLTGTKTTRTISPGWAEHSQHWNPGKTNPFPFVKSTRVTCGLHFGIPTVLTHLGPGNYNVADDKAKQKFISAARSQQQSFQALVFAGEFGETVRMLRHPADAVVKSLVGYMDLLKKRVPTWLRQHSRLPRHRQLPAMHKTLANQWLEYCYGWKPLLMDLDNAMQAVANYNTGELEVVEIHAVGKDDYAQPATQATDSATGQNIGYQYQQKTIYQVNYYGAIRLHQPNTSAAASHIFGYDPSSWIPSVWELIPYSFVVDYFSNVGAIIDALCFYSSDIIWVNRTVRRESIWTCQDTSHTPSIYLNFVEDYRRFEPAKAEVRTMEVTRTAYTGGSLVPFLEFKVPGSGSLRWANLAALGASHLRLSRLITNSLGAKRS